MVRGRAGDVARVDRRTMGEKQLDQGGSARLGRMGLRRTVLNIYGGRTVMTGAKDRWDKVAYLAAPSEWHRV